MSARPSRRAAARRAAIIESEDEGDMVAETTKKIKEEESEDEFAPETSTTRASRRQTQSRRKSTAPATPRANRSRKSVVPEPSIEASEILDPDQSVATVIGPEPSTVKKASPRKRKSVAPRKATKEATPDSQPPMPTPAQSEEPSELHGTPLADITDQSINEQRHPADDTVTKVKPIRPMDTILEKPMDIVLKSRKMVVPVVEDTGPKARIVITYLILNNFKSYAGRQEVGPFHSSFSSVVGPNGSGKSNVIDSLLFVFGFRASKMRQGKISALIHNSAAHPDLDHCEVAVHFQEVMDLVSLRRHSILQLQLANLSYNSPVVGRKSSLTPNLSYPGKPLRTIRANTTSMVASPISLP